MTIHWLPTDTLLPPNTGRNKAKLARITKSMAGSGWRGRPLAVVDLDNGTFQALTGSHRIAAARSVGVEEIPVVLLPDGIKHHWWGVFSRHGKLVNEHNAEYALEQMNLLDEAALVAED